MRVRCANPGATRRMAVEGDRAFEEQRHRDIEDVLRAARLCSALAGTLLGGAAAAADVHVMISAGFYGAYAELAPAFERATGHHLVTTRGPSVGDSPEAIPTRLAKGETADVVILDDASADELGRRGLVRPDSKVEFARSQIGMAVRAGAPKSLDISSVDAFRNVLLAAKSVGYSDSKHQRHLPGDDAVRQARHRGAVGGQEPQGARPALGRAGGGRRWRAAKREIGFQQVSELVHVPGITVVGPIPAEPAAALRLFGRADDSRQGTRCGARPAPLHRLARGRRHHPGRGPGADSSSLEAAHGSSARMRSQSGSRRGLAPGAVARTRRLPRPRPPPSSTCSRQPPARRRAWPRPVPQRLAP